MNKFNWRIWIGKRFYEFTMGMIVMSVANLALTGVAASDKVMTLIPEEFRSIKILVVTIMFITFFGTWGVGVFFDRVVHLQQTLNTQNAVRTDQIEEIRTGIKEINRKLYKLNVSIKSK